MSDKPSAAWYLAPIFLGIIGAAIMWYVLKDEDHPDSPKMIKKGWVIGIVLTVLSVAWIPIVMIPMMFMGGFDQQHMMQPISEHVERMVPAPTQQPIEKSLEQSLEEAREKIEDAVDDVCDSSYPDVCIAAYPPDLDCGEIQYANFRVVGSDPHGFDRDNDGIGCES